MTKKAHKDNKDGRFLKWLNTNTSALRFRRRVAQAPGNVVGVLTGAVTATGAATSSEQSWPGYLKSAAKGIYEIPQHIWRTVCGVRDVAEGADRIYNTATPAREHLEQLVYSVKNISPLHPIRSLDQVQDSYHLFNQSGGELLRVVGEQEQQIQGHVVQRVDEISQLVHNAINNFSDDPYRAGAVVGLCLAAGVSLGWGLGKYVTVRLPLLKSIAGKRETTFSEDLIYGSKLALDKLSEPLFLVPVALGLAKESAYSAVRGVGTEIYKNILKAQTSGAELLHKFGDLGKSTWSGIKSIFTGESVGQVTTVQDVLDSGYRAVSDGSAALESFTRISPAMESLRPVPERTAFFDFLDHTREGAYSLYNLGRQIVEGQWDVDQLRASVPQITEGVINMAVNAYQYPLATAGVLGTAYVAAKALPLAYSAGMHSIHDYFSEKETQKECKPKLRRKSGTRMNINLLKPKS